MATANKPKRIRKPAVKKTSVGSVAAAPKIKIVASGASAVPKAKFAAPTEVLELLEQLRIKLVYLPEAHAAEANALHSKIIQALDK